MRQIDKFGNPAPPPLGAGQIVRIVLMSGAVLTLLLAAVFVLAMLGGDDYGCILDGCNG